MRIGVNYQLKYSTPEDWIACLRSLGVCAAVSPVQPGADKDTVAAYKRAAEENGILIGEVGVWNNPLARDDAKRRAAVEQCKEGLRLADELGALCCVNITGSRGEIWDSYHPDNYSADTYALIVDTIREIIDDVQPVRTCYSAEPMPWMLPDSPESYLKLMQDVDRSGFGIHMDYTNMINSFERYRNRRAFLGHAFHLLAPYIRSVHIKDMALKPGLPLIMQETVPGEGDIDLGHVLRLCSELDHEVTLFLEHMPELSQYITGLSNIRKKAAEAGVTLM